MREWNECLPTGRMDMWSFLRWKFREVRCFKSRKKRSVKLLCSLGVVQTVEEHGRSCCHLKGGVSGRGICEAILHSGSQSDYAFSLFSLIEFDSR